MSISVYNDTKYLYNRLATYFITSNRDINIPGDVETLCLHSKVSCSIIPGDMEINVSGNLDALNPNYKLPCYATTAYLKIIITGYMGTLYPYNQLPSYFVTGDQNSYISRYAATKELQCPNALSGRSKRKSGAPDFFRLPCGAGLFLVYRWYTSPSRLMQRISKKYTLWYTQVIKYCGYE
ncbi:MAG TPA: hypothetical protein VGI43_05320 [Mucilaginibacter sp.]